MFNMWKSEFKKTEGEIWPYEELIQIALWQRKNSWYVTNREKANMKSFL